MTPEEEVVVLRAELAEARVLIARLQEELERLRSERTDSPSFLKPNTPKPKDNPDKKPRRKRTKAQNGARKRETPTQVVLHTMEQCPDCRYPLSRHLLANRRQVIELPAPAPVEIIEHQVFKSWCARCQRWHYAPVDLSGQVVGEGRSRSRMGVRIASLIAYLRSALRLPVHQIKEYLLTMHNLHVSSGEIVGLSHRVADAEPVKQAAQSIKEQVRGNCIVHGDETGWREGGQNGYIWCFCTPQGERWYEYDKSRAGTVVKRILGTQFKGTLVTDFYAAYNDLPCEHQRCWAHLLRDLHNLKEEHKENMEVLGWVAAVRKLYDQGQASVHHPHGPHGPPSQEQREAQYTELVEGARELGSRYAQAKSHREHPCHTLSKRLLLHLDGLFQFVLQPGLSADNNLAERSIRSLVVARKVSGGSRSPKGSATRMTLASLFATWRAKGLNPFTQCFLLLSQPHPSVPLL